MASTPRSRYRPQILTLCAMFVVAAVSFTQLYALDYDLQQTIIDPNAPVDMCPNIGGVQATIPSGMELDIDGNCYTPTPPPPEPPVVVDLCSNIAGTQTTLPEGYYRTTDGRCFVQPPKPAEPIDVCSNLEDVQLAVPDGYYVDTDNLCYQIPPPTDVCSNINGPQATLPDGMVVEDGICYTPTAPSPGPTTPSTSTGSTPIANVPAPLVPIVEPIVNLVPETTRTWLRSLPPTVAQTAPYYIFAVVGLIAVGILLQSLREAEFIRQLLLLLKREHAIAEQKDTFIALASHYLRTPLTLMEGGLDAIVIARELDAETIRPISEIIKALQAKVSVILDDIQQNTALRDIVAPNAAAQNTPSVWRSPFFLGTLIGSVVLTGLANFFFAIVGNQAIGTGNFIVQIVFAIAAIAILYLTIRNLYVKRKLHNEHERLIQHERTIDEARNIFITQTTIALRESLSEINASRSIIADAPSVSYFDNGYNRLSSILERFLLLGQIQAGVDRTLETINVQQVINNALVRYQTAISEKQLTVTNQVGSLIIKQNPLLFDFVINSLIDNAIKFNELGGTITISAHPDAATLRIEVADNGIGIDEAKLSQLFQPFTRATSAMEFNYEGLGFSLFLDKIIMDYTGGTIAAESEIKRGTTLTVAAPLSPEA